MNRQILNPLGMTSDSKDWTEDSEHENGDYICRCYRCGSEFIGHKRRNVCRRCCFEVMNVGGTVS